MMPVSRQERPSTQCARQATILGCCRRSLPARSQPPSCTVPAFARPNRVTYVSSVRGSTWMRRHQFLSLMGGTLPGTPWFAACFGNGKNRTDPVGLLMGWGPEGSGRSRRQWRAIPLPPSTASGCPTTGDRERGRHLTFTNGTRSRSFNGVSGRHRWGWRETPGSRPRPFAPRCPSSAPSRQVPDGGSVDQHEGGPRPVAPGVGRMPAFTQLSQVLGEMRNSAAPASRSTKAGVRTGRRISALASLGRGPHFSRRRGSDCSRR